MQAELAILLPVETLKVLSASVSIPFRIIHASGADYFVSPGFEASSLAGTEYDLRDGEKLLGKLVFAASPAPAHQAAVAAASALIDRWLRCSQERDLFQFDAEHRKLLIRQIQSVSTRLSQILDPALAVSAFIDEIRTIFLVQRISVFTSNAKNEISRADQFGTPIEDFETVRYVCYSGKPLISDAPESDSRLLSLEGEARPEIARIKNLLVVPLSAHKKNLGAVYLADRDDGPFSQVEVQVLANLAQILANSLSQIESHRLLVKNEQVRTTLSRYLSPNLVQKISENSNVADTWKGNRIVGTVLFSDLRGFTKLSERYSPEQIVAHLNDYFEEMTQEIFKEDGTLDKFVGDMIMAVYGAPNPMADAPERAIRSAIAMQRRLKKLNVEWAKVGRPAFEMGIGINTGPMVFGNLGSKQAMGITVIGDSVNIGQRLQSVAKAGEILISKGLFEALPANHSYAAENLGEIEVKGKKISALKLRYE